MADKAKGSVAVDVMKGVALVGFGALEGYAFTRTGILDPQAMRQQMLFKSMIIMKLFLSAVGASLLFQTPMSFIDKKHFAATRGYNKKALTYSRVMLGCAILGVGMFLCGSGPTLMPSQLAAGVGSALSMLAGAFAGGLVYGLLEPSLFSGAPSVKPADPLDKNTSYASVAFPMGVVLVGAVVGLEWFWPHSGDVAQLTSTVPNPWLPLYAGVAIGFNQIPMRLLADRGQGGSTPVMNIISTATLGKVAPKMKMATVASTFQTLYVYPGTFLGAWLAMVHMGWPQAAVGPSSLVAFAGGFLMLFGGRFADGCTCGHGITGMSELSPVSVAGAMCIFGGGIAAGVVGLFI
uniref:Uncharacterized protein n=1 Tax=Chromera velia CCMP2878 TaxID=1169474 RepID=A0A0G4HJ53_9ALVE|eukprot:Cvel_28158.t1-p1 / transcript=Cvel_28158.t1 / gene=Cvel_28158 / organism=Chromera_velia_CCMP2878 / gene_product=hypothetical protein / transcript_product=hypothetical protein / location=Cvel_scaffold3637:10861-13166(-) / protein_length=348 / sequence_SO=supercontig / SO=protein_coding / is_pseudo=false